MIEVNERVDVPAAPRFVWDLLADRRHRMRAHALGCQLALGDELLDGGDVNCAVDLAEQFGLGLGEVAVTDRLDQKIAQGLAFEQFAEHIRKEVAKWADVVKRSGAKVD